MIEEVIYGFISLFLVLIIPLGLTVLNIFNLFAQNPVKVRRTAYATVIYGAILYAALFETLYQPNGDWNEAVYPFETHYPLSSEYFFSVAFPCLAGFAALLLLHSKKSDTLPPLVSAFSVAAVFILNVFSLVFAVHISKSFEITNLMLYLYHFNIFVLSISGIRKQIREQLEYFSRIREEKVYVSGISCWLGKHIKLISQYSVLVFACLFLAVCIMEIIFILTGQGADAQVKAFTETADWIFSGQLPPPPKEYQGHYLCTVAAGGHRKVVKPLRYGKRRGAVIIVNRQLCIANAFEDFIAEKLPRFHRAVRGFYDKYGYPVSQFITTPLKADIIYIIMKPLEWMFLAFLYLFDRNPEKRISRQYH